MAMCASKPGKADVSCGDGCCVAVAKQGRVVFPARGQNPFGHLHLNIKHVLVAEVSMTLEK